MGFKSGNILDILKVITKITILTFFSGRVKSVAKKVMPKREGLRPKPYPAEKPSETFMNFIKNIRAEKRKSQPYPPPGVTVNEFLTYKKAKFLLQINQIRDFLRVSLNIKVLNGLEATLENIMYFAGNCDSGYLTLQVRNFWTKKSIKILLI